MIVISLIEEFFLGRGDIYFCGGKIISPLKLNEGEVSALLNQSQEIFLSFSPCLDLFLFLLKKGKKILIPLSAIRTKDILRLSEEAVGLSPKIQTKSDGKFIIYWIPSEEINL